MSCQAGPLPWVTGRKQGHLGSVSGAEKTGRQSFLNIKEFACWQGLHPLACGDDCSVLSKPPIFSSGKWDKTSHCSGSCLPSPHQHAGPRAFTLSPGECSPAQSSHARTVPEPRRQGRWRGRPSWGRVSASHGDLQSQAWEGAGPGLPAQTFPPQSQHPRLRIHATNPN